MDNNGFLSIRGMDRVPNTRVRELCGVRKGVDERIDEGLLPCFGRLERMKNDSFAMEVYVEESARDRLIQ